MSRPVYTAAFDCGCLIFVREDTPLAAELDRLWEEVTDAPSTHRMPKARCIIHSPTHLACVARLESSGDGIWPASLDGRTD